MSKAYERKLNHLCEQVQSISHRLLATRDALKNPIFTDEGRADWGRTFGNAIHDMPPIWSGSASVLACKRKLHNFDYQPSKDHFNSRQRCGEEIVLLIIRRFGDRLVPTQDEVAEILDRARCVHYVTEKENQNVRPFMADGASPEQAYEQAGVVLVHNVQDLFGRRGPKTPQYKRDMRRKYLTTLQ